MYLSVFNAPNGEIFFDLKGSPAGKIENAPDMLPRLGVTLHLDKSLSEVKYFGKGREKTM